MKEEGPLETIVHVRGRKVMMDGPTLELIV